MSDSQGNSSSSYFYSSSTSATDGTTRSGHRYTTSARTAPDGETTVRTTHQDLGEPPVVEEYRYDGRGQDLLPESGTSAGGVRRITEVDEEPSSIYGSGMAGREDV
ncbi:hypothetical protein FE257_006404 [Aspergillus nanangensis]|uniref:Uncharacterized protein n=1 Tax=Aspergillus nanangensis TaxID=2582783 RepID=A0AAD4GZ97_ASPNN|nr:hypothetical protein FE257_006404 [Aspergillus nanangensis]